ALHESAHEPYSLHEPIESDSLVDSVNALRLEEVNGERPHPVAGDSFRAKKAGVIRPRGKDLRTDRHIAIFSMNLALDQMEEGRMQRRERRRSVSGENLFDGCSMRRNDVAQPGDACVRILVRQIEESH